MKNYTKIKECTTDFSDKNYEPCFGNVEVIYLYLKSDLNTGCTQNGNNFKNSQLTNGEEGYFKEKEFFVY